VAVVCFGGCYAADPPPGADCATDNVCPAPLACSLVTNTCELHPVALVQQATAYAASAPVLSVTLPQVPAAGDVLVMIGANPDSSLDSVTGAGATWQRAARSTANANVELWYGTTDGSNDTVTIALAGATAPMSLEVVEWLGLAPPGVLDSEVHLAGRTSPASAGTLSTAAPDLVMFAVGDGGPNTFGIPSPGAWIALASIDEPAHEQSVWFVAAQTPDTFSPAVTETANHWDAILVGLELAPAD